MSDAVCIVKVSARAWVPVVVQETRCWAVAQRGLRFYIDGTTEAEIRRCATDPSVVKYKTRKAAVEAIGVGGES